MQNIATIFERTIQDLFGLEIKVAFTRPDEQFGDLATSVALQIAKKIGQSPREVATRIADAAKDALSTNVADLSVAGPGFINLTLSDNELMGQAQAAAAEKTKAYQDKVVVAEYSDLNPFKVVHAGHLYTTVVGNAIANLLEHAGARVHRVNFGGDVGLHVGKATWAIIGGDESKALQEVQSLAKKPLHDRAAWMAECYVKGTSAYEDDAEAKKAIIQMNKKIYQIHEQNDYTSSLAKIYRTCRAWSYEYFDAFYQELGVHAFEKYYPESVTAPIGLKTVREQLARGVYQKGEGGATIFDGEKHGLHTRVFINSEGLPTYEAKDVGLIMLKWRDYHFDLSFIMTGNDIVEYMKVVLKSIEQFEPDLPPRTRHLTHGMVKLEGGVKMSSRKGNILLATDVLQAAETAASDKQTAYAAVKYAFLKQRIGGDIIFNPKESVALEGNSGPYLQYAHARARSILAKASGRQDPGDFVDLQPAERSLARKLTEYPDVFDKAVAELMPHHICTYLYELAQTFNRFYEHNRVIGDDRQALRLQLVQCYADVLKDGLSLLHLPAPDRL